MSTKNKQTEEEIMDTLQKITSKKCFWVNLTKDVKDLYNKSFGSQD